jgi:hypothetical protein
VKFCGEDSTYSLYINATAWTSPTNRTNPDTDGDGLTDRVEVNGSSFTIILVGGTRQVNRSMSSPNLVDTDGDGVPDVKEALLGSNATNNDTDGDGLRAAERTTRAGGSPALAKALLAM